MSAVSLVFFLLCVGVCACHMCTTGLCAKMYDHDTVCLSFQERTTAVQVQLIAKSASLAGRMYNALHKKLTMTNEKNSTDQTQRYAFTAKNNVPYYRTTEKQLCTANKRREKNVIRTPVLTQAENPRRERTVRSHPLTRQRTRSTLTSCQSIYRAIPAAFQTLLSSFAC